MSKNYKLKDGRYLKIDKTSNGYEYSLYKNCKTLLDGGILELQEPSEEEILKEVLKLYDIPNVIGVVEFNEDVEEINSLEKIFDEKKIREVIKLLTKKMKHWR